MHVLAIGASRNIGYFSCLQLLEQGHTVTYLLRKPEVIEQDPKIKSYVQQGKAKCIKGDATVRADVQNAFDAATPADGTLDVVLSSVGGTPSFSPLKGFVVNPPNLCCSCVFNILAVLPEETPTSPQPKLIIVSSYGLTRVSHNALPLMLKPLYSYALRSPHADKLVMERAIFYAANWTWPQDELKETEAFIGEDWKKELREPGYLKNIVVIRPSLLVDSDKPAKGAYRASADELKGAYTISRGEVAHFVVEGVIKKWEEWKGKVASVST